MRGLSCEVEFFTLDGGIAAVATVETGKMQPFKKS